MIAVALKATLRRLAPVYAAIALVYITARLYGAAFATAVLIAFAWLALALAMDRREKTREQMRFYLKARARRHNELQKRGEFR